MTTFILICQGNSLQDSRLVSVSTDHRIIKTVANLMAGEGAEVSNGLIRNPEEACRSGKKKSSQCGDRS